MTAALETLSLSKTFGALAVTKQVNLRLERGARHALIGPNGAGKTTLINLMTGQLPPGAGQVFIDGQDVTGLSQSARVKRGLARTFQINTLFRNLSVLENVSMAVSERRGRAGDMFRFAGSRRDIVEEAYELLVRLRLASEAMRPVREIAYGRQRLVELAIALGLQPQVLLLDEPAAGVPSGESALILEVMAELPEDMAILIIEHDMNLVCRFANRITVLVQGAVLTEGTPAEVMADPKVREVYLGEGHA